MAANAGTNWLFQKRTWLAGAVAAGVLVGINMPEFWKGPGTGGGTSVVPGTQGTTESKTDSSAQAEKPVTATRTVSESSPLKSPNSSPATPPPVEKPAVIKVTVDERTFSLRSEEAGERPIELRELIEMVKTAKGDADGIRLRIYRKPSSRASAEMALQTALTDAGIREEAVHWVPTATE